MYQFIWLCSYLGTAQSPAAFSFPLMGVVSGRYHYMEVLLQLDSCIPPKPPMVWPCSPTPFRSQVLAQYLAHHPDQMFAQYIQHVFPQAEPTFYSRMSRGNQTAPCRRKSRLGAWLVLFTHHYPTSSTLVQWGWSPNLIPQQNTGSSWTSQLRGGIV